MLTDVEINAEELFVVAFLNFTPVVIQALNLYLLLLSSHLFQMTLGPAGSIDHLVEHSPFIRPI